MKLEFLLLGFACLFCSLFFSAWNQLAGLKKEHDKTKKLLYGNLTDFEKLAYIIDLYYQINFQKLRPDQIKLWHDWVSKNLK